jgi:hypothetical protein
VVKKADGGSVSAQIPFEKREQTVYVLTVDKTGPKLIKGQSDPRAPGLDSGHLGILEELAN